MAEDDDRVIKPTLSYSPYYEAYPRSSSPYFKLRRSIYDDRLFELCSNDPPRNQPLVTSTFKESLTLLLIEAGRPRWSYYRSYSEDTGNNTVYKKAIVAAANFATLLVNKDAISDYSKQSKLLIQMKRLWNYASIHGKKGDSSAQAWKKCLSEVERETNKYSLITEPYLATLIRDYHNALESYPIQFNQPYIHCSPGSYFRFCLIKKDYSRHVDVEDEVRAMTSSLILTVDEHTAIMFMIARGMIDEVVSMYFDLLITPDDGNVFERNVEGPGNELDMLLGTLAHHFQREIWEDLSLFNCFWIAMGQTPECFPSAALVEVLEVAELRRRALGTRFIGVKIFIWSFYICGYGLPASVAMQLKTLLSTDSETHHLSQIYPAVIDLVTSLGLKTVELEHFLFIILNLEQPAGSNVQHFKEFMEMVDKDMEEQRKRTTRSWPFTSVIGIGRRVVEMKLLKLKKRKHIETEGTS